MGHAMESHHVFQFGLGPPRSAIRVIYGKHDKIVSRRRLGTGAVRSSHDIRPVQWMTLCAVRSPLVPLELENLELEGITHYPLRHPGWVDPYNTGHGSRMDI